MKEEEFIPGKVAEFIADPDIWGIVMSVSDCGGCVYLQRFGKGAEGSIGYSGVCRTLLRVVNAKN